jgi:protein-S-isoprenylcysteine O-methyltransferase Ste14
VNGLLYPVCALLLLEFGFLVFRRIVARSYLTKGRLSPTASFLQLAVFAGFFSFPYLYMPPEWAWDWLPNGTWNRMAALVLVALGMVLAFGTMGWFGIGRAFGMQVRGLLRKGPYRFSRNPQMLGGWLMVVGVVFYEPSFHATGWVLIWLVLGHWMITSEEEHLRGVFGEEYNAYCQETPRYLLR